MRFTFAQSPVAKSPFEPESQGALTKLNMAKSVSSEHLTMTKFWSTLSYRLESLIEKNVFFEVLWKMVFLG